MPWTHWQRGALPQRTVAITFDDGFRNNYTVAAPILRELQLPATIFLATDVIGTTHTLWPDRIYVAVHASTAKTIDASCLALGTLDLSSDEARGHAIHEILEGLKRRPVHMWPDLVDELERALGSGGAGRGRTLSTYALGPGERVARVGPCSPRRAYEDPSHSFASCK